MTNHKNSLFYTILIKYQVFCHLYKLQSAQQMMEVHWKYTKQLKKRF